MSLYDPREFPETVSTDFTLEEFLAWVRTKPADETYNVFWSNECALGQFGTATGRTHLHRCYNPDRDLGIEGLNYALGFRDEDQSHLTFGQVAARLEAKLAR